MSPGEGRTHPLAPDITRSSQSSSPKRQRVNPTNPAQIARPTQRAPKSCLECTRRKIRCDKQQPCEACVLRGEGYVCRREAVLHKGSVVSGDLSERAYAVSDLVAEVADLRERVKSLERKQLEVDPGQERGAGRQSWIGTGPSTPVRQDTEYDQYRLPGTMEEFALGIGETTRWKGASLLSTGSSGPPATRSGTASASSLWYQPIPHLTTLSSLPSRPVCTSLLGFYLDELAWMTCAINGPTLIAEHTRFWDEYEQTAIRDDSWLACLFAVLSISAFFMDENQAASRGLSIQHLQQVAPTWFNSSIETLYRCGLTIAPSLLTCQTMQILGPAFHLTGNTTLHQTLTPLVHLQMRLINLHLLGHRSRDVQDESLSKEVGRRVWWNSIEVDWAFLPYYRYTQFFPHQLSTAFPETSDDAYPCSDGEPSLQYRVACYRSSRIIFDLYGNLALTQNPTYDQVVSASKDLDALRNNLHAELRYSSNENTHGPLTMPSNRRRLLALTLAYRSYQLHRLFFVKSLTEKRYAESFQACIGAANTIFDVMESGLPPVYYKLWNVTVAVVVAGIISALHLLQVARTGIPPPSPQRQRIQHLIERLKALDDRSGIARRGSIFIEYLLKAGTDVASGEGDLSFTRESIIDLIQTVDEVADNRQAPNAGSGGITANDLFFGDMTNATVDQEFLHDPVVPWYPHSADFDFTSLLNDFMANGQS